MAGNAGSRRMAVAYQQQMNETLPEEVVDERRSHVNPETPRSRRASVTVS
jgi:hypothetical protein